MTKITTYNTASLYNLEISTSITECMPLQRSHHLSCKFILKGTRIEKPIISGSSGAMCPILAILLSRQKQRLLFNFMCSTIQKSPKGKIGKDTMLKFYKDVAGPYRLRGREI